MDWTVTTICNGLKAIVVVLLVGYTANGPVTVSAAAKAVKEVAEENDDQTESVSPAEMELIRAVEKTRIETIQKVIGSVVAVYGEDRQGGGSGVIIDPDGTALTNHHVIAGAGISGLGGLADGNLYEWDLIGTDPGGDVAIIKLKGKDTFPFSPLGDSDQVKIGDWALAMGNPFLLAHDQVPTVTLGVVSGIERYQGGAGGNQLVYGNCIQIDSSINPGNSGGPLFNMNGEVIGINGRGSFRDRGRVNVGLGYAISSNQIKNFMPDLMATKLVEHGTLDASFSNRDGSVVCSTLNLDSPIAQAGLELGDRLLEFEGRKITYANQFTNMICTLPEDWPATLTFVKQDGREVTATVRLFGLPYNIQIDEEPETPPGDQPEDEGEEGEGEDGKDEQNDDEGGQQEDDNESDEEPGDQTPPQDDSQQAKRNELKELMTSEPGVVLDPDVNQLYVQKLFRWWRSHVASEEAPNGLKVMRMDDAIRTADEQSGQQTLWLCNDGRVRVEYQLGSENRVYGFDGNTFWTIKDDKPVKLTLIQAKINPIITQAMCLVGPLTDQPLGVFGKPILDGSDKAKQTLACRIMYLDEDDDWFYCWLSLFDAQSRPHAQLLKASDSRDGDKDGGAITFDQWRDVDGVKVPFEKTLVKGLSEIVQWTASTAECRWLDETDTSLFEFPGGNTGTENASDE